LSKKFLFRAFKSHWIEEIAGWGNGTNDATWAVPCQPITALRVKNLRKKGDGREIKNFLSGLFCQKNISGKEKKGGLRKGEKWD